MATILDRILETKASETKALHASPGLEALRVLADGAPAGPRFREAVEASARPVALIAEVKKASPSKGVIRADFDPIQIARSYEAGGAAALSVLTDEAYFQGSLDDLRAVRGAVSLPLLRKDFVVDPIQIYEARAAGASAVLLIAAAMEAAKLADLHACAKECGLDVLVEVHTVEERDAVLKACPAIDLLGVNNRDLNTFDVDLDVTRRLAAGLPPSILLVSESGISTRDDVLRAAECGARAVLVGESLMRQADPGRAAAQLLGRRGG